MELTAKKVADMEIGGFLGEHFSCACGKTHFMDMDNIFIESGAINRVAKVVQSYKAKEPLIIADENTFKVAGEKVAQKLEDAKMPELNIARSFFPASLFSFPTKKPPAVFSLQSARKLICFWLSAPASSTTLLNTSAAALIFLKSS